MIAGDHIRGDECRTPETASTKRTIQSNRRQPPETNEYGQHCDGQLELATSLSVERTSGSATRGGLEFDFVRAEAVESHPILL